MVLIKVNKFGYMNVGDVTLASKKTKAKAFIKFYSGVKWALFKNNFYEEAIKGEFPNEHYLNKSSVPIYRAYKDGKKICSLFSRETEAGFKFIVSIQRKTNKKTMKKYFQYYYISSGFDKNYNIIMPTQVTRNTKANHGW